jgi:hypothetical protein
VNETERVQLLNTLKSLSIALDPNQTEKIKKPLGIHPSFSKEKNYSANDSEALEKILEAFKSFTLPKRVVEIETMAVFGEKGMKGRFPNQPFWLFAHFEKELSDQNLRWATIPISKVSAQGFRSIGDRGEKAFFELTQNRETITKAPRPALSGQGQDTAVPFARYGLMQSWVRNRVRIHHGNIPSEEIGDFESSLRQIERIENPRRHNLKSVDCVSCHIALPLRELANELLQKERYVNANSPVAYDWNGLVRDPSPDRYSLEFGKITSVRKPVSGEFFESSRIDSWTVRQFGFVGTRPYLSQRVINDSAEAALIATLMLNHSSEASP